MWRSSLDSYRDSDSETIANDHVLRHPYGNLVAELPTPQQHVTRDAAVDPAAL